MKWQRKARHIDYTEKLLMLRGKLKFKNVW